MYTPVSCVVTGQQWGVERFPPPSSSSSSSSHSPPLKSWRCNLASLSHSCNLFFLACNSAIHIHEPGFPAQTLSAPIRVLDVPHSGDSHRGHPGIDPHDPHSVTRVLVDWFGDEEVLVCACDDGDVVVWWVREIHRAIVAKRNNPGADEKDELYAIRPFGVQWMGASAWGLAVHREARLIAISANTHEVRVLVYGLAKGDDGDDDDGDFPRYRDRVITLRTNTNIPSVTFNNTGADPEGRWLASSSIDGLTYLWDLTSPDRPARVIALGFCVNPTSHFNTISSSCNCPDRYSVPHATWGAMFLDPRSFHEADSLADAYGPGIELKNKVSYGASCFWDITLPKPEKASRKAKTRPKPNVGSEVSSSYGEEDEDSDSLFVPATSVNVPSPPPDTSTVLSLPTHTLNSTSLLIEDETSDDDDDDDDDDYLDLEIHPNYTNSIASHEARAQVFRSRSLYCAFDTTNHHQKYLNNPTYTPCPLLIITRSEIYLLPHPISPTPTTHPIIAMRNPLYAAQPTVTSALHRHCFSAQIPELGIFIVASPSGRAAVFRLTRTRWNGEVRYGFRMEWLLQWARVVEPPGESTPGEEVYAKVLVGLGVAPVQGMEEREGRRWRVVLYYQDHTVVAYEVGKFAGEEGVGVEELVV